MEKTLANKFVEQITQYTDYNINIMDEQGIVIASSDAVRIGTFHEVAYRIITGTEDVVITENQDDYPEVKPGINMVIIIDGKREGVVGITGDPESAKPIALVIKMAIEAMLKYEKQQEDILRRQNKKEQFIALLTHENTEKPEVLRSMAKELNYSEQVIRIPILCSFSKVAPERLLEQVKMGTNHGAQDISFLVDDHHILIFKSVGNDVGKVFSEYKVVLEEYLQPVRIWIENQGESLHCYIGSFQGSFSQYCHGYHHSRWLEMTVQEEKAPSNLFFYDYSGRYMQSITPMNELQRMFHIYERELGNEFKQNYLEVMETLISNNYNLSLAAKAMYVHKNTLLYRYNKIRETLHVNPITTSSDRFFLEAFYSYLKKRGGVVSSIQK